MAEAKNHLLNSEEQLIALKIQIDEIYYAFPKSNALIQFVRELRLLHDFLKDDVVYPDEMIGKIAGETVVMLNKLNLLPRQCFNVQEIKTKAHKIMFGYQDDMHSFIVKSKQIIQNQDKHDKILFGIIGGLVGLVIGALFGPISALCGFATGAAITNKISTYHASRFFKKVEQIENQLTERINTLASHESHFINELEEEDVSISHVYN